MKIVLPSLFALCAALWMQNAVADNAANQRVFNLEQQRLGYCVQVYGNYTCTPKDAGGPSYREVKDPLSDLAKQRSAALNMKMQGLMNTQVALSISRKSGNWGVVVGDGHANLKEMQITSMAACVSKDTGISIDKLSKNRHNLLKIMEENGSECKLGNPSETPRTMAMFRNRLPDGSYNFHGAFSQKLWVENDEFVKQRDDCKKEADNCELIGHFDQPGVY